MKTSYLTEEERKMPIEAILLQVALGLQTCKTKGDVVDLLREVYHLGYERGKGATK